MSTSLQGALFDDDMPARCLPPGVRLAPDVIGAAEEAAAIELIEKLDLTPFAFRGFFGKRRTVSFGWRYDFNGGGFQKSAPMPMFLETLRRTAADVANIPADAFEQALVSEYSEGAGIGWHRDRPQFGEIVALSFAAPCRLRFRRQQERRWDRIDTIAPPRAAYLLSGEGREVWEHSIPPVTALRYSITFRTLRAGIAVSTKSSTP